VISSSEYLGRIQRIKDLCSAEGLDAFLVTSSDNLYYLTGKSCMPFERPFVLIIRPEGQVTFMVPRLEEEHLRVIGHITDFVTYYEYPAPENDNWQKTLKDQLWGAKKLGTDLYTRSEIFSFLARIADVECYDWVYVQRFAKSPAELLMLREAARYVKPSMTDFIRSVRRGSMVLDTLGPAKKAQQKALLDRGFNIDFMAFSFQSGAWPGARSAEPHSIPNPVDQFGSGPNVMIMSYRVDGYAIELERTFFTQRPDEVMQKRFAHMLEARRIAFSLLKPGAACHHIDEAVRSFLLDQGYKDNVIHRSGHGMGVSNHEGPFLAIGSDTILAPGMVLTVEPGIYFKGHGAYRHSDTVVITEDGYDCLTDVPTDIDSLTNCKKAGAITLLKRSIIKGLIKKNT